MFLPTTAAELKTLGWDRLDVILVTGDAYIDSPYIGVAVIGKVLLAAGYKVGIIAQPSLDDGHDISRLGEPRLFWGVSSGCVDSMVANYTALKKRRQQDDFTPGGRNNRRPDRAVIAYTNLIRRHFKNTVPVVLGGIEASLRRVAHYDYWDDAVRRSLLFDAKADYLVYGMGEAAILELAAALQNGGTVEKLRGLSYIAKEPPGDYLELPAFEVVQAKPAAFLKMFRYFYANNEPLTARGLVQLHGDRWLVQNPPAPYPNTTELDRIYGLDYERDAHLYEKKQGNIRALDTIRFSITTHLGCYGECNFCAIATHQGRTVRSRSEASILAEAEKITKLSNFKGYILDVGGPTANMYGFECWRKRKQGPCPDKRCLFPGVCSALQTSHQRQLELLKKLRRLPGVKQIVVASGLRYDLVLADRKYGQLYLKDLVNHHISGQLKVAPEHVSPKVMRLMGKPGQKLLLEFKALFDRLNREFGKKQFLTYYLIAAHPGCGEAEMQELKSFTSRQLRLSPEQVQIFTPLPSTWSAAMYHTGIDPFSKEPIFVEKELRKKEEQKAIIIGKIGKK
jgi:uncharacterized radical SAM protein YgiQ